MHSIINKTAKIILLAFWLIPTQAFAARIFLETKNSTPARGDEFIVEVFVDGGEKPINAVAGSLVFLDNHFDVVEVHNGNSIVSFWAKYPALGLAGNVDFSGIIPGGYQGARGLLYTIVFKAKAPGEDTITVREPVVLLNDGVGTAVKTVVAPLKITTQEGNSNAISVATEDTEGPESFVPAVARDQELFLGKYFVAFATQDKGSGIDHYEVREGWWGRFVRVASPYELKNQLLDQRIFVKAVDKKGNSRIEMLPAPLGAPWYSSYAFIAILFVFVACVIYAAKSIYAKNL